MSHRVALVSIGSFSWANPILADALAREFDPVPVGRIDLADVT
jgi:hypothetical protein